MDINIDRYDNFPDFLEAFYVSRNVKATEVAKTLNFSTQLLSQYKNRNNGKLPSIAFLTKFSKVYNLDYDKLLRLLERSKETKKSSREERSKEDIKLDHTSNHLEGLLNKNPGLDKLLINIANLNDDIQIKAIEEIEELIKSKVYDSIAKFSQKELKDRLLSTFVLWKKENEPPGYDYPVRENNVEELEGHLELSNESLFISFIATRQYLSITTRYQDRFHLEEFKELVPGLVLTENKVGDLGKVYKDVNLYVLRVINPVPFVQHVKSVVNKLGTSVHRITFEKCSVEAYFINN